MRRALIQPIIFASGISLFLFAHNSQLPISAYIAPFPFWVTLGRPLGLIWNNKVIKEINKDVFPSQMKNYRELYLVSRRALAYDIIFNHSFYNPLLALLIIGYTHGLKRIQDKYRGQSKETTTMMDILKKAGGNLVKMRALISLASIISQYWISYFSLKKTVEGNLQMGVGSKRILLMKELILNFGWHSYLLKKINETYQI